MKTTRFFASVLAAVMTAVTASTMVMTALAAGPASGEEYKWDMKQLSYLRSALNG